MEEDELDTAQIARQALELPPLPDWENNRLSYMRDVLQSKFGGFSYDLLMQLLATEDREIVYLTETPSFWGVTRSGAGENRLGHLLMQLRDQARENLERLRQRYLRYLNLEYANALKAHKKSLSDYGWIDANHFLLIPKKGAESFSAPYMAAVRGPAYLTLFIAPSRVEQMRRLIGVTLYPTQEKAHEAQGWDAFSMVDNVISQEVGPLRLSRYTAKIFPPEARAPSIGVVISSNPTAVAPSTREVISSSTPAEATSTSTSSRITRPYSNIPSLQEVIRNLRGGGRTGE